MCHNSFLVSLSKMRCGHAHFYVVITVEYQHFFCELFHFVEHF